MEDKSRPFWRQAGTPNRFSVGQFPNSPYAQELAHVSPYIGFAPPLEEEFQRTHLQRVRRRVRTWFGLASVIAVGATVAQLHFTGIGSVSAVVSASVLLPCALVLLGLSWSSHYQQLYMPVAPVLVTMLNAIIAVFIALAVAAGRGDALATLTVSMISIFLTAGLLYRQAIIAAAITWISFASAAVVAGFDVVEMFECLSVLTITVFIGAFVLRDNEQAYRRSFLENALIGELVVRDGLCGIMNRRAFDDHLARVWNLALRDHRLIAVLMVDIDYFKKYNDEFGHQAGDLALRSVAGVVQGFARRPLDLAARYGGEEFAVILYDLVLAHVQETAELLREAVRGLRFGLNAESPLARGVTVSVGASVVVPRVGRTAEGAVQLADEALYEAKASGRDKVIIKGGECYEGLDTGEFRANSTPIG